MPMSPVDFALAFSTGLVAFAFVLSGVTKLTRSSQTLVTMAALRVPVLLRRRFLARVLPFAELLLGVVLVLASGILLIASAAVAGIVLTFFTSLLIGVLRRDEEVDCGCFGILSTDRVSGISVVRNVVLIAAAVVITLFGTGGESLIAMLALPPSVFAMTLWLSWAILAIALLIRALLRPERSAPADAPPGVVPARSWSTIPPLSPISLALGLDPARPGEVSMGDPIPSAELVAGNGATQPLSGLGHGQPVLLIFLSAECGTCVPVAQAAAAWQTTLGPLQVRIATSSQPDAIAAISPDLLPLTRFGSQAALRAIGVQRTPAAVVLGGQQHQMIASPIAYGLHEIEPLVHGLLASRL